MTWVSNLHAEKGIGPDSGRIPASLGTNEDDPPDETRTTMITKALLFLSTTGLLHAGSPESPSQTASKPEPWLKPLVDVRVRHEFGDVDGFDASHALTIRERIGFQTKKFNGFSLLAEGEFTQVPVGDYNGGGGKFAYPFNPGNTTIGDPRTNEINQAFVSYEGFDTVAKLGRQRIVYDNSAFIGDVIWRQNQQTYDGLSLTNKSIAGLTLDYAYIGQVNRVFGSEADAPITPAFANVQDLSSEIHLFHGSYTGIKRLTLGGYAYLMEFDDRANYDNNTFGATAKDDLLGRSRSMESWPFRIKRESPLRKIPLGIPTSSPPRSSVSRRFRTDLSIWTRAFKTRYPPSMHSTAGRTDSSAVAPRAIKTDSPTSISPTASRFSTGSSGPT
jgi:hypothetical protein